MSEELNTTQRIAAGIDLLDRNVQDWINDININTLDVSDTSNCPLGQVFRNRSTDVYRIYNNARYFLYGIDTLNISGSTSLYGFARPSNISFQELTNEWKAQLKLRFQEHSD